MRSFLFKTREYVSLFSIISYLLTVISLILFLIVISSTGFADFFNYYLSAPTRAIMAWICVIFPFSVAEVVVLTSPILLGILIFIIVKQAKKGKKASIKLLNIIISVLCLVFVTFVWTYSSGYHTSTIDEKMNLDRSAISKEELYKTSEIFVNELNSLVDKIEFDDTGASVMPYSYAEMSGKICDAYDSFVEKHDGVIHTFYSRVKPLIISEPMTYTHLSGIYTFMSGEANVNVNYPDFIVATTAAHEMAHQRGVAREDEANFIAFAVLLESNDPFLRYSAFVDLFPNILNNLYDEDEELYFSLASNLDKRVFKDRASYSKFFEKYANSTASQVTGSINDAYLQANGQVEGTKSYGMVTEIVCAYLLGKTK